MNSVILLYTFQHQSEWELVTFSLTNVSWNTAFRSLSIYSNHGKLTLALPTMFSQRAVLSKAVEVCFLSTTSRVLHLNESVCPNHHSESVWSSHLVHCSLGTYFGGTSQPILLVCPVFKWSQEMGSSLQDGGVLCHLIQKHSEQNQ